MSLNRTQCPHCFTTYLISEEQYRVSDGMVRCGTCRERFQARLVVSPDAPKFDPRKAFIEPISEEPIEPPAGLTDEPSDIQFAESVETDELEQPTIAFSGLENSINSELSIDFDDDAPTTPTNSDDLDVEAVLANIRARTQQKEAETEVDPDQISPSNTNQQQEFTLAESPQVLPSEDAEHSDPRHMNEDRQAEASAPSEEKIAPNITSEPISDRTSEDALINEVNELIDNKLIGSNEKVQVSAAATGSEFMVNPRPARKTSRWLLIVVPLLLLLIGAFSVTLIYQLWMKQLIVFPEDSRAEQLIQAGVSPVAERLAQRKIELPVRRNLSKLELLSARTEPHPSRASTNLLRVELVNRAKIAQPLPWLELTLTDAEGRLVSRRQLAPRDYIYNNKTEAQIGPKELKKITIELLAFPKQATGYELRLLSK